MELRPPPDIANRSSGLAADQKPHICIIGSDALAFPLAEKLQPKIHDGLIETFDSAERLLSTDNSEAFDFVILAHESFSAEGALLLRQLKLLDTDPAVLVVTHPERESKEILRWLQAGADRVLFSGDRFAEEALQHIAALERARKSQEADTMSRARSLELLKRLSQKATRFEEFGMTVAHDIRGPLGNIQMQLEYALDSFSSEMPPRCKAVLQKVVGSAERLQTMVQSMYQYAKFGAQASKKTEVQLEQLVGTVISDLNIDERLDVTVELGSLPSVWGNADLLRQAFINLITNAIKYSDKKAIKIKISGFQQNGPSPVAMAVLQVEDNGPGIPENQRAQLVSMFQRGEDQQSEGLGVGLAVVSRICEVHLGQLSIGASALGGALFTLELPCQPIVP